MNATPLQVTVIGGGMITHGQILPSLYHWQRSGVIGAISICALNSAPLRQLAAEPSFSEAFPGLSFTPHPGLDVPEEQQFPGIYKDVVSAMPPGNLVVVAVPDQLHYEVILFALEHDQHILTVKPLVLKYSQAVEIEKRALEKGLFVGIEYHKRFDRRSLPGWTLRGIQVRRVQAGGTLVLPAFQFPELVHQGKYRSFHLYWMPLCRPGLVYHRAEAGGGFSPRG